jgi:signal transduction histidine kinase
VKRRGGPVDPAEALLRRTRTRLALLTLATVTTLVVIVGVTTAVTAITLMRESVDRALLLAAADQLVLHQLLDGESEGGSGSALGEADTFVMLATADGRLRSSTRNTKLSGLPDRAAIAAAEQGQDFRDSRYGSTDVRLLTMRVAGDVKSSDDSETGDDGDASSSPLYLQAGMNMALQHRLERQLLLAIVVIGALGILGAMIVTLVVTQRALVPIREAFATERRFVAAASHELQTPVAIIRASAEILERERLVAGDGATLVDDIIGETDRLGRLVSDLLALASAEAGAISLHPEVIDLEAWFADLARRAAAIAEASGASFTTSQDHVSGLAVTADRDRLDQLVLILVDNAIKHSPPGGSVQLSLLDQRRSGTAVIQVSDEGPGIPAEELERIFEPFVRVPGTRRATGGTGLGLAIARQLAVRQGGELTVASSPGAGAIFSLSLRLSILPT